MIIPWNWYEITAATSPVPGHCAPIPTVCQCCPMPVQSQVRMPLVERKHHQLRRWGQETTTQYRLQTGGTHTNKYAEQDLPAHHMQSYLGLEESDTTITCSMLSR